MIKPTEEKWEVLESEELMRLGYFRIRQEKLKLPDGRIMPKYWIVDFNNWVQVLPITSQGEVILVRQYRHAKGVYTLEVPGGSTDLDKGESEEAAALRELEEETGYTGKISFLTNHYPNPALQSNEIHCYLATDCKKVAEQKLDPYEVVDVELVPVDELYQMAEDGLIKHSLILSTLFLAQPRLRQLGFL